VNMNIHPLAENRVTNSNYRCDYGHSRKVTCGPFAGAHDPQRQHKCGRSYKNVPGAAVGRRSDSVKSVTACQIHLRRKRPCGTHEAYAGRFGIRYRSSSFSKASAMCVPDWWA
jgi:hypothetical protein